MVRKTYLRALISVAFCLCLPPSQVESKKDPALTTDMCMKFLSTDTEAQSKVQRQLENEILSQIKMNPKWIITKTEIPSSCKANPCMLSNLDVIPRATVGDIVVQIELDEPGTELKEKAARELRETPDIMEKSITKLQELIREEQRKNGLVAPVDNVAWLKRFLRPTQYYPEKAFEKVKNYYTQRNKLKDLYKNLKPSNEETLFNQDTMTVLPVRDQEGRRVLILEVGSKWDYKDCSLDEIYKGAVLFLEAALLEPGTQIAGAAIIFDMEGLDFARTMQFVKNPSFGFRVVELLQKAAPIRIMGLHVVNESSYFSMVLGVFTRLMEEEFKKLIHVHGKNMDSLHEYIYADRLPPKYGGTSTIPRLPGPAWYTALTMLDREYEAVGSYGYNRRTK